MLPNDQRDDSGARCPECGRLMALGQIGPQMVLALARPLVTFNDCDRTSGPPALERPGPAYLRLLGYRSMRHFMVVAHCERLLTTAICADENLVLQIKSAVTSLDQLEL